MTKLLTSVRNLEEAKLALAGGSDWLDLKEPAAGALGAVSPEVVTQVVAWANTHAKQTPVSATIGDCWEQPELIPKRVANMSELGVDFVKVGIFADCISTETTAAIKNSVGCEAKLIVLCFAESLPSAKSISKILALGVSGLMLDTAEKHSGSLTDKVSLREIQEFVSSVRNSGRLCGIAGSLRAADIKSLTGLGMDYLGFRGALCDRHERAGTISGEQVALLKENLQRNNSQDRQELIYSKTNSNLE